MVSRFEGDPKMVLTENGSNLIFRGGQPEMDQGLENAVMISLDTRKGWCGNVFFKKPSEKIGSDYEENNEQSITVTSLNENRMAAEKALQWFINDGIFNSVDVKVINPTFNSKEVIILVSPPPQVLKLSKSGVNWQLQKVNPANLRI